MKESPTILIAPDSFKESLSAQEVCLAIQRGIQKVYPEATFILSPIADGGEGTLDAVIIAAGGVKKQLEVCDPLGRSILAHYGIIEASKTGIIEMAAASGLGLLKLPERDPAITSTYGTGQLIKQCLADGMRTILIGVGGSATNDGGRGMAEALGVRFLDRNGQLLPSGVPPLMQLAKIDVSKLDPRVAETTFIIATDVDNPLCGANGASVVFGPQKGADKKLVQALDNALHHYGELIGQTLGKDVLSLKGAGAAGGLAAGLAAFTNATIENGAEIVMTYTDLAEKMQQADLCLTGEGKLDDQSKAGKVPVAVAKLAAHYHVPVIALAGSITAENAALYQEGFTSAFSIQPGVIDLETAMQQTGVSLERVSENIARILRLKKEAGT
ncbi:Glycerate kinase [Listeria grayi]|uniref:glycerate kinase n=1 Tax=Listeria grayi TaxID=1641 RepID=UPI000F71CA09|nr:glycerate kinase [Listeria grayi]VEI36043.1 Glycerate kinase [Listeria grayi]